MHVKPRRHLLFLALFLTLANIGQAQPTDPVDGGAPDSTEVPITGLEILLAGGAAYGARKIYRSRKNR